MNRKHSVQEFIYQGEHPDSSVELPRDWELPNKEQELIRAIQRENANAEACANELIENYNWGLAKVKRILNNGGK